MAVAREWRGRGVGSALMAAGVEWARERGGLHKLSLEVFAHNDAGIALYRKFGFVEEGRRVKQYRRQSGELWDTIEMGSCSDRQPISISTGRPIRPSARRWRWCDRMATRSDGCAV